MVMSMTVILGAARDRRFSIPDRSAHLFRHARRHPRRRTRGPRSGADVGREVLAGEGGAGGDEVGGCALGDDPAAVVAGAGTEVDDPVTVIVRFVVRVLRGWP